jgi:hypothetical protein
MATVNRRAALGALVGVAALAILPAAAVSPPSAAAAPAIAAHKAVQDALDAMPSQPDEDDAYDAACDLEAAALEAVAETPCESDADFFVEAAYLIERERKAWGTELSDCAHFGLLALATELHEVIPKQWRASVALFSWTPSVSQN